MIGPLGPLRLGTHGGGARHASTGKTGAIERRAYHTGGAFKRRLIFCFTQFGIVDGIAPQEHALGAVRVVGGGGAVAVLFAPRDLTLFVERVNQLVQIFDSLDDQAADDGYYQRSPKIISVLCVEELFQLLYYMYRSLIILFSGTHETAFSVGVFAIGTNLERPIGRLQKRLHKKPFHPYRRQF